MRERANTLRQIRQVRGLTVEALACLVGRHKSTVSRVERGLVEPTPETIVAIAKALGIAVGRAQRLTLLKRDASAGNGGAGKVRDDGAQPAE